MMRRFGAAPGGGGGGAFADYAEYRAHVTGLAVNGSFTNANYGVGLNYFISGTGIWRMIYTGTQFGPGGMWGSPFAANRAVTNDSKSGRVIQHGIESLGAVDFGHENVYLLDVTGIVSLPTSSVTRNGFTSESYGTYGCFQINSLVYWDYSLGRARHFDAVTQTYSDYAG